MTCGYPFPMHIQCVSHSIFNSGQHFTLSFSTYSSHAPVMPTRLLIAHPPAYQTSYSASPGSSTGYVYTMAVEHSLLVYTMAVEHSLLVYRMAVEYSLLVYRMAVEHSLLRRRRSGTSYPGDGVS